MDVRPTVYQAAGGDAAMLALARAWHARCLADPVAAHPFDHTPLHPQHSERLAAYWGEMLGGPPDYTTKYGSVADVIRMHSGNGPHDDLDARALACFVAALDDAQLPDDPDLRRTLTAWFEWSNRLVNHSYRRAESVPDDATLPHWGWDGPAG